MNPPTDTSELNPPTPLGLEEPVVPATEEAGPIAAPAVPSTAASEMGDVDVTVDEILAQLQEGLQKAEATMSSILESIVDDNAVVLAELESALSDMEATLTQD